MACMLCTQKARLNLQISIVPKHQIESNPRALPGKRPKKIKEKYFKGEYKIPKFLNTIRYEAPLKKEKEKMI